MFSTLSDHYIVCGAGRVGRGVVEELIRSHVPVVVIDNSSDRAQWAFDRDIPAIVADATHDETLREAHVKSAKGLVAAISSDAGNVYITLAARSLNPDLRISARSSDEQAEEKLRIAGATTVLTPYPFIGHRLAQSMIRPHVLSFLDIASAFSQTSGHELEIEQVTLGPSADIVGKTFEEAKIRNRYDVIILAIQPVAAEGMEFNPSAQMRMEEGDTLIVMGDILILKRMESDFER